MKKILFILILVSVACCQQTYEQFITSFANGIKYAGNPIVKHVTATWKARQTHYPYIIPNPWQPDSVLVYFGGGDYTAGNFNIGVASAPKISLVSWTEYASNPLLTFPTSGGSPQAYQTVGPHLVYFDADSNKIFMHSTCFNNGATQSWQGRFSSTDGYTFTYLGAVLQASGDETVLGDAGYLQDGNNWYCYYTYRTAAATLPGIRLATSTDCVNWTKPMTQILSIGDSGSYDSRFIEGCQSLKIGSKYVLLYSCYNGTTNSNGNWVSAIASSDSYNGPFVKEAQPVLTKSTSGWDSVYIATAFKYNDYVFYQGTKSGGDYNAAMWDIGAFKLNVDIVDNTKPAAVTGVSYYVKQKIKKVIINDVYQNFLIPIKIPRTGRVLSNCDNGSHVVVYDKDGTKLPRRVVFTSDTIYLYTNFKVNGISDTFLFVGFGKTLTETNSAQAFTNSGITHYWGYDSSGTSGIDYVGTLHQTLTAPDTQNSSPTNKFKGSLYSATNGRSACSGQPLSNATAFTLSMWVYNTATGTQMLFTNRNASQPYIQLYIYNANSIVCHVGGSSYSFTSTYPLMSLNQWVNIVVAYDGAKSDNLGRLKIYVNGFLSTGNYGGTIPASVPTFTGYTSIASIDGTPTYAMNGYVDNVSLSVGVAKTSTYIADQYMFQNDLLYGTQSFQQTLSTGSRWSAYKQAYKSAYKQAWK